MIGNQIKNYRNKKGISQEELGAAVFVTGKHLSYIETGAKAPSLELLILIANALDVSADDLLVDNLTHTSSPVGQELHAIFSIAATAKSPMVFLLLTTVSESNFSDKCFKGILLTKELTLLASIVITSII